MAEETTTDAAAQETTSLRVTEGTADLPDGGSNTEEAVRAREDNFKIAAETADSRRATGRYFVFSEGSVYLVDFRENDDDDETRGCDCRHALWDDSRCEHQRRVALEITYGDLAAPGELAFDFEIGDNVWVNWAQGEGEESIVSGEVQDIIEGEEGEFVVSVVDSEHHEFDAGKEYFARPEWLTPR